jgi:hypothetical protein
MNFEGLELENSSCLVGSLSIPHPTSLESTNVILNSQNESCNNFEDDFVEDESQSTSTRSSRRKKKGIILSSSQLKKMSAAYSATGTNNQEVKEIENNDSEQSNLKIKENDANIENITSLLPLISPSTSLIIASNELLIEKRNIIKDKIVLAEKRVQKRYMSIIKIQRAWRLWLQIPDNINDEFCFYLIRNWSNDKIKYFIESKLLENDNIGEKKFLSKNQRYKLIIKSILSIQLWWKDRLHKKLKLYCQNWNWEKSTADKVFALCLGYRVRKLTRSDGILKLICNIRDIRRVLVEIIMTESPLESSKSLNSIIIFESVLHSIKLKNELILFPKVPPSDWLLVRNLLKQIENDKRNIFDTLFKSCIFYSPTSSSLNIGYWDLLPAVKRRLLYEENKKQDMLIAKNSSGKTPPRIPRDRSSITSPKFAESPQQSRNSHLKSPPNTTPSLIKKPKSLHEVLTEVRDKELISDSPVNIQTLKSSLVLVKHHLRNKLNSPCQSTSDQDSHQSISPSICDEYNNSQTFRLPNSVDNRPLPTHSGQRNLHNEILQNEEAQLQSIQSQNILSKSNQNSSSPLLSSRHRQGMKAHIQLDIISAEKLMSAKKGERKLADRKPCLRVEMYLPISLLDNKTVTEDGGSKLLPELRLAHKTGKDFEIITLNPHFDSSFYLPLSCPKAFIHNFIEKEKIRNETSGLDNDYSTIDSIDLIHSRLCKELLVWWSSAGAFIKIQVVDGERFNEDIFLGEISLLLSSFLVPVKGRLHYEFSSTLSLNKINPSDRVSGTISFHSYLHMPQSIYIQELVKNLSSRNSNRSSPAPMDRRSPSEFNESTDINKSPVSEITDNPTSSPFQLFHTRGQKENNFKSNENQDLLIESINGFTDISQNNNMEYEINNDEKEIEEVNEKSIVLERLKERMSRKTNDLSWGKRWGDIEKQVSNVQDKIKFIIKEESNDSDVMEWEREKKNKVSDINIKSSANINNISPPPNTNLSLSRSVRRSQMMVDVTKCLDGLSVIQKTTDTMLGKINKKLEARRSSIDEVENSSFDDVYESCEDELIIRREDEIEKDYGENLEDSNDDLNNNQNIESFFRTKSQSIEENDFVIQSHDYDEEEKKEVFIDNDILDKNNTSLNFMAESNQLKVSSFDNFAEHNDDVIFCDDASSECESDSELNIIKDEEYNEKKPYFVDFSYLNLSNIDRVNPLPRDTKPNLPKVTIDLDLSS